MASTKHLQMCKKIAHLTKCVYNLNKINEDNEFDRLAQDKALKDAEDRLSRLKAEIDEKDQQAEKASEERRRMARQQEQEKEAARKRMAKAREEHKREIGRQKHENELLVEELKSELGGELEAKEKIIQANEHHHQALKDAEGCLSRLKAETNELGRELEAKQQTLKANDHRHRVQLDQLVAAHENEMNSLRAQHLAEKQEAVQEAVAAANEKADKRIARLHDELSEAEKNVEQERRQDNEEKQRLRSEISRLTKDSIGLSDALKESQEAREKANGQIVRLDSALGKERSIAMGKLAAAEAKEGHLQAEIANNRREIDELQDCVAKLKAEVLLKGEEANMLESKLKKSLATINALQKEHSERMSEAAAVKGEHQSQLACLQKEKSRLERALCDSTRMSKATAEKCTVLLSMLGDVRREHMDVRSAINDMLSETKSALTIALKTAKQDGERAVQQLRETQRVANDDLERIEYYWKGKAEDCSAKQAAVETLEKKIRKNDADILVLAESAREEKSRCRVLEQTVERQCEQLDILIDEKSKLNATIKSRDVQIERLTTSTRELNLLVSGGRDEAKKASEREIEAALTDQEKMHREQLAAALADQEEKHNEDLAEMRDRHNHSLNVRSSEEAELQQRRLREYEDRLNDCLEKLDQHDMAAEEASAARCRQVAELEAQHSAAIANLESRLAELAQDHSRRVGELELHYAENNAAMKSQNAQERDSAESMYANAMETAELKLRHANETAEKRLHQAKADYDRKIQEMRRDLTLQHRTEVKTLQKGHAEEKGIRKTVEEELDAFKGRNDDLATEVARLKEDLNQRDDMLKIARKQSEYDRLRNEKRLKDMEDRGGVHPLDCNGVLFGNDCGTKLAIEEVMRYLGWWHVATIGSGERKVSGEILVYVKPSKKAAVLVHRAFCVLAGPTDDNSLDRIIVRSMSASMVRQVLVEVCDLSDVEPAKCLHPDFVSDEEAEEIFCPFLFGLYNFEHAHRGLHYHKIHSVAFVRNTLAGIDLNCLTENNFPKSPKGAPMTHLARIHWRRLLQQDQKPEGIISDGTISAVECIDDNGGGSDDNALEEALNGYMYDFVGTDGMSAAEGYAADETFRLVDKAINILVKANSEAGQIHTAVRNVDGMLVKNRDHYWRRIRQYFDTESDFWGKVEDGIELLRFTDEHGKRIYHEVSPPLDQAELQQRKKHKKSTGFSIAQRQDVDAMLEHGKKKWFFIRGAGKEQIPVPDSVQKFIIQHQNRQDLEQPSIPVFDTWTVKGLRKNLGKRRKDNSNFTTTFQHVKGKTPPGGGQRTNVIMDGYALVFLCDSSENTKKMYLT